VDDDVGWTTQKSSKYATDSVARLSSRLFSLHGRHKHAQNGAARAAPAPVAAAVDTKESDEPKLVTIELKIPSKFYGRIIGEGGQSLAALQQVWR